MRRECRNAMLLVAAIVALPGCELLQRQPVDDDGRTMMMIADTVPLGPEEQPYANGRAMPVPVEPSPFESRNGRAPAAMLSDIQPPRSPSDKSGGEKRAIPREPIR